MDVQFAVPSRKRTELMEHVLAILPSPLIFVADEEADSYLAAGVPKDQIRVHPNLYGLARIRNWINDHVDAEVVVQCDDDLKHVCCWPGLKPRRLQDPESIMALAQQTAQVAKDMRTPLFGWSNAGQPRFYKPHDPFSFLGPVGRVLGVVGRQLRWDEQLISMVDTDAKLECLLRYRVVLCDTRFYWDCGRIYGNTGGCQDIRTEAVRNRDRRLMKLKWGDAFDIDRKSRVGSSTNKVCVVRRMAL